MNGHPEVITVNEVESQAFGPLWKLPQDILRKAWIKGFPLKSTVRLIALTDKMSQVNQLFDAMPYLSNDDVSAIRRLEPEVWPFQSAVMYLATNTWRAMFCKACGKRFVAATSQSAYCSKTCFESKRVSAKRAWWNEHGSEQRRAKKKK